MAEKAFQIAVIGGGPAGYVAAIRGAQLGASVVLFEKDTIGGTCLNRGCIPTKTYIKTADVLNEIRSASQRGIKNDPNAVVDMPVVKAYKDQVVRQLTSGVAALLRSNRVTVIKGEASLVDEHTILCNGASYQADSILLCGGAKACSIPIPGIEDPNVLNSTDILEITELPRRLAIIGGGVIGCEMATAFRGFGSEVTIVEAADRLLPMMDRELSEALAPCMEKQGVRLMLSSQITRIENAGSSSRILCAGGDVVEADKILLSVGRTTDTSCLGALAGRLAVENGKVLADEHLRTSIPNIYAAGDINGKLMLAHTAFKMGEVAAENAMGIHRSINLSAVPSCVYTSPQAASVGITEAEAEAKYGAASLKIGRFPFSANGRSLASGETEGFVKVIVLEKYSELLGVHIFGAQAAEMISEPASLIASEVTAEEAADIIHAHPSVSEAFMEACSAALGRCIHLPAKH